MLENVFHLSGAGQELVFFLRLVLAVAAGAMVGVEREFRGRPAGLRTHILVSLGAAILSLISLELATLVNAKSGDFAIRVDVSRIAAGMITGIGFLGAGTIIKMGKSVRGLTTAASIWCVASIGMGFGFGFYKLSILGSLFMLFIIIVIHYLEKGLVRDWYKNVLVQFKGSRIRIKELNIKFLERGWAIIDMDLKKDKAKDEYEVNFEMRFRDKNQIDDVVRVLDETDFVTGYRIE